MHFMKAIQVFYDKEWRGGLWARKQTVWQSNTLVSGLGFVVAGV